MGSLDFSAILPVVPYLFGTGMTLTLALTGLAGTLGLVLGILLAMMRLSASRPVSMIAGAYVSLMRSVPLLLVIFWFYFLVPYLGAWVLQSPRPVQVGAFNSAIISFTLFEAAYFCEIMRAGILSVSTGQRSAGMALGLSYRQTMTNVILPQALRNMGPSLITRLITLFQDTALVYVVALTDFLGAATKIGQRDGRLTEMYLFVAAVYLIVCFSASQLVKRLERRTAAAR